MSKKVWPIICPEPFKGIRLVVGGFTRRCQLEIMINPPSVPFWPIFATRSSVCINIVIDVSLIHWETQGTIQIFLSIPGLRSSCRLNRLSLIRDLHGVHLLRHPFHDGANLRHQDFSQWSFLDEWVCILWHWISLFIL